MLNVITLFSGYDSQALALNRLGVDYDLAAWCEIDKHAITAHNALFPQWQDRNLGDVSKVDWAEWHKQHPEHIDLLTYSSPCQDFSSAGLQRGGEEGSGTRSGLLWETERAVRELRPRHLVFENVGGLVSDKFIDLFNRWQARLNGYGYTNFSQLMNAKDYGCPQNRLRIFMVSILDCDRAYYFPKPFKLERRLKDVLEQNVEERYYLSEENVRKLLWFNEDRKEKGIGFRFSPHDKNDAYASTINASVRPRQTDNFIAEPKINTLCKLSSSQNSRIISTEGISPAVINGEKDGIIKIAEQKDLVFIPDGKGGYKQVDRESEEWYRYSNEYWSKVVGSNIAEPQMLGWTRNEKGEITDRHPVSVANCVTAAKRDNTQNYVMEPCISSIRGRADGEWNSSEHKQRLEIGGSDTSNSLTSVAKDNLLIEPTIISPGHGYFDGAVNTETSPTVKCSAMQAQHFVSNGIRIRRLTERELFRLMDVDEKDIDTLLSAGIPKTQLSKLAGNSIVVNVLYHIFRTLLVDTEPEKGQQTTLF